MKLGSTEKALLLRGLENPYGRFDVTVAHGHKARRGGSGLREQVAATSLVVRGYAMREPGEGKGGKDRNVVRGRATSYITSTYRLTDEGLKTARELAVSS